MTAPIVQRLRETAASLTEERVSMQTLAHAHGTAAHGTLLLLMAGPCLLPVPGVGTVLGLFMGLVGVLFMPLVGAAVGEYLAQKNQVRAVKVGVATWVGIMLGLIAKVALAFIMVGIFVAALLL